jgi:hypothetical protein
MHNSFLLFIQDKAEEAQQEEARKMKLTYWKIKKYLVEKFNTGFCLENLFLKLNRRLIWSTVCSLRTF